ncbi:MAG: hypothetical protein EXS13_10735 [Planctomycetes bacterium]|nr:hypothetical protein [Planctomycetota bacterium]
MARDAADWIVLAGSGALVAALALFAPRLPATVLRATPFVVAAAVLASCLANGLPAAGGSSPLPWFALAGGAALLLLILDRIKGSRAAGTIGTVLATLLALLSVVYLAWTGKRHELPGIGAVWSLDDDMMITLRYAQNLARGDGLVWNPGERVEGITNLLWALLLAPVHALLGSTRAAAGAIALNGALLVALVLATARLVRQLGGSRLGAGLAAIALATHQATLHWAAAGGESVLLTLLLVVVAQVALASSIAPRTALCAGVLSGLAWCTRPDAIALLAPLLGLIAWRLRDPTAPWRAPLQFAAAAAALPIAATLFRLAYFGSALPNTYWLKMTGWDGRDAAGVAYVGNGLAHHFGFAAAALIGTLLLRSRGALALMFAVLLHAGYVIHAGGDELPFERFLLPALPFVLALGFAGATAHATANARTASADSAPVAAVAATLLLALGTSGGGFMPGTRDPAQERRSKAERASTMIGLLLRENTLPNARIAHFWAGSAAYFSERPGLDLLGKCDPVIARQLAKPGLNKPGHNKYDFAYAFSREPDVIVGGAGGNATLQILSDTYVSPESPQHGYLAFAHLYSARGFPELFGRCSKDQIGTPTRMPQLVGGAGTQLAFEWAEVSRAFHAVFVRHGSTRAKPPADWVPPRPKDSP